MCVCVWGGGRGKIAWPGDGKQLAVSYGYDYEHLFTTLINGQTVDFVTAISGFASITSDLTA